MRITRRIKNRFTEQAKSHKCNSLKVKSVFVENDKKIQTTDRTVETVVKRIKSSEVSCENFVKFFHKQEKRWKRKKKKRNLKEADKCNGGPNTCQTDFPTALEKMEKNVRESKNTSQYQRGKEKISTCEGAKRLHDTMSARLASSRFRYLNEQLYSITSQQAAEMFSNDSQAYQIYHEGYKMQVKRWPMNPQDVFIKQLRKLPTSTVIADLGCGNALIAKTLSQHRVLSYDLVATDPLVTQCDMASIPLKSSCVDVAIFCLSLMGVNLDDFIFEANRILKTGGELRVAEVVSRFNNIKLFTKAVEKYGFELQSQSIQSRMFIFFHFVKERNPKRGRLPALKLKPCVYKKR